MIGLGILLSAVYVPGWTGAAILPGWIVLSVVLPFLLFRRIEMGLGHWLGLIFLFYATLSMLWTPIWQQGVWDLWLIWILAFCFCLGSQYYDPKLWVGMALGLLVPLGFALGQWLGDNNPDAHHFTIEWFKTHQIYANTSGNSTGLFPGTFINPDMFGETACLITVALIVSRIYWPLLITLPPVYLTQARTVYVAYAAVIAYALWDRWRWRSMIPGTIMLLLAALYVTSNHKDSIQERLNLWGDTAQAVTFKGYGAGSFFMLYPKFAKRTDTMATRPEDPHNEYLNLAFEYGLGSIPVLALLALGFWAGGPERYILVAFAAIAFFSFPTRIPTEGFVGMVALGRLCRPGNLAWIDKLASRSLLDAWSRCKSRADSALEPIRAYAGRV